MVLRLTVVILLSLSLIACGGGGGGSGWTKQPTLGITSSYATYHQGCTHSTIIYAPLYEGLSSLYLTPVTGVVMAITISGSSPNTITSILDSTAQFDFTVP